MTNPVNTYSANTGNIVPPRFALCQNCLVEVNESSRGCSECSGTGLAEIPFPDVIGKLRRGNNGSNL